MKPVQQVISAAAIPHVHYTGQLERGIVVVNNLAKRGRRGTGQRFTLEWEELFRTAVASARPISYIRGQASGVEKEI